MSNPQPSCSPQYGTEVPAVTSWCTHGFAPGGMCPFGCGHHIRPQQLAA